jgi:hypothetical protein
MPEPEAHRSHAGPADSCLFWRILISGNHHHPFQQRERPPLLRRMRPGPPPVGWTVVHSCFLHQTTSLAPLHFNDKSRRPATDRRWRTRSVFEGGGALGLYSAGGGCAVGVFADGYGRTISLLTELGNIIQGGRGYNYFAPERGWGKGPAATSSASAARHICRTPPPSDQNSPVQGRHRQGRLRKGAACPKAVSGCIRLACSSPITCHSSLLVAPRRRWRYVAGHEAGD